MRKIPLYALLFLAVSPAYALDFSFEKDHCAAGEYRPKEPKSGGTMGFTRCSILRRDRSTPFG